MVVAGRRELGLCWRRNWSLNVQVKVLEERLEVWKRQELVNK